MFTTPIKYLPLKTMEELKSFSYRSGMSYMKKIYWLNSSQIAYVDEKGDLYVTPCQIGIEDILVKNGYVKEGMQIPKVHDKAAYQWLERIAKTNNLAYTHAEAAKLAQQKGVEQTTVAIEEVLQLTEIVNSYNDGGRKYLPMTQMFLVNGTDKNIGTFIIIDEKTIFICDEYGRSFLVKVKTAVNNLVNALIVAGYTYTTHPEMYVRETE